MSHTKVCRICSIDKPTISFYKSTARTRDGLRHECKECTNQRSLIYHSKNKERHRERGRRYHLKSKYGITKEVVDKMLDDQEYCCAICQKSLDTFVIDHCHTTGKVRGLLCNHCNWLLGHAKDNKNILQGALKYLDSH